MFGLFEGGNLPLVCFKDHSGNFSKSQFFGILGSLWRFLGALGGRWGGLSVF